MNPNRPEADTEYSRGRRPSGGPSGGRGGASAGARGAGGGGVPRGAPAPLRILILAGGLAGAILLGIAEFTPLLHVHAGPGGGVVDTISTGSHQSYALLPVAALAFVFALGIWRTRSRLALLATGLLGVLSLLIALLGDLPDARASGLIGGPATHFSIAGATPAVGLYLETAGAVILLITAVAGLVLLPPPHPPPRARRRPSAGSGSGSSTEGARPGK